MTTSSYGSYPYNYLLRKETEVFPFLAPAKTKTKTKTNILKEENQLVWCGP